MTRRSPRDRGPRRPHRGRVAAVDRILDLRLAEAALEREAERDLALEADAGAFEQREDRRGVDAGAVGRGGRRGHRVGGGAQGRAQVGVEERRACRRRRLGAERAQAIRGVTQRARAGRPPACPAVPRGSAAWPRHAAGRRAAGARRSAAAAAGAGAAAAGGACGVARGSASSATAAAAVSSARRTRSVIAPNRSIVDQSAAGARRTPVQGPIKCADICSAPFRSTRGDRMQISLAWPTCAAALTLGLAVPAAAQDVTFAFTGILTANENSPYPELTPGTPFSGTYTFNLLAADTNPHPGGGNYPHSGAPYGITVRIGDRVFQTDPDWQPYPPFVIDVIDDADGRDLYQVLSVGNLPVDGIPIGEIYFLLEDPTRSQLSSGALTASSPDVSHWQQPYGFVVAGQGGFWMIRGQLTAITGGGPGTPEIPGPPGPAGVPGPQGPQGIPGAPGETGLSGPIGAIGSPGVVGPEGPGGAPGVAGALGSSGAPGPIGLAGSTGARGEGTFSGSLITVARNSAPPAGYTFVATVELPRSGPGRVVVDLYRRN